MKHADDHGHGKPPARGPSSHQDNGGAPSGGHGDDGGHGGNDRRMQSREAMRE